MEKYDYYEAYTFLKKNRPYNVHWWHRQTTDYHRHVDFYELFMTTEDGLIQYYNGTKMTLSAKTVYLIPIMQYHRIDFVKNVGTSNFFTLGASKQFFEHSTVTFSPALLQAMQGERCIVIQPDNASYEFLLSLAKHATYDENEEHCMLATRFFLSTVAMLYQTQTSRDEALSQQQRYARDIRDKIDNLEFIDRDVTKIYSDYPLTPSLLIRGFRELTGSTIVKYQIARRMKYACALLTSTDYSILHISSTVGYDSLSHFMDTFKKFTGSTPAAYRKQAHADEK